jgi:hypothetical protein
LTVSSAWTRVISPTKVTEARFGYSGFEFGNDEPAFMVGQPQFSFPGLTIGAPQNQPNHFYQRQYQVHYDFSWYAGTHSLKMGAEYFRNNDHGYWFVNGNGTYTFRPRPPDLVSSFPASAWNNPSAWNLTGLDSYVLRFDKNFNRQGWQISMPQNTFAFWFGDTWKLTKNLTVNYGLRWDADLGVANPPGIPNSTININNGLVSGDFGYKQGGSDLTNFAPRAGFAYRVGRQGGLVIRRKRRRLLDDLIGPLTSRVFGRLDRVAALAAENAYEPAHGVLLPARRFHDLGQRSTVRASHHRNDLGLLIAVICNFISVRRAGRLLGSLDLLTRFAGFARYLRLLRCGFTRLSIPGQRLDRDPRQE